MSRRRMGLNDPSTLRGRVESVVADYDPRQQVTAEWVDQALAVVLELLTAIEEMDARVAAVEGAVANRVDLRALLGEWNR